MAVEAAMSPVVARAEVLRELYEAMDAPTLERYRQRAFEHLAAQHARGELAQSVRALFLTARRPA